MLTERTVDVQVLLKTQIQYPDTGSHDPKVQKTMFQTSRLQEIMKVPLVTVIDEVAKVSGVMQRQVLTIREVEKDQKPEEAQVSFKVCVHRVKDGQNDIYEPQEAGQGALLVLTSKARRTKAKCRKTRTSVHKCKAKCKVPREKRVQRAAADETAPEMMEARKRAVWLHQTCRPVDQCTQVRVEECPLSTRHEARSKQEQSAAKVKALEEGLAGKTVRIAEFKSGVFSTQNWRGQIDHWHVHNFDRWHLRCPRDTQVTVLLQLTLR